MQSSIEERFPSACGAIDVKDVWRFGASFTKHTCANRLKDLVLFIRQRIQRKVRLLRLQNSVGGPGLVSQFFGDVSRA